MIRNAFWFFAGMAFALVAMVYSVEYPVTIRRKRKPEPDEEPWFA